MKEQEKKIIEAVSKDIAALKPKPAQKIPSRELILTKQEIMKTNAVWFLADICYSLMYELDRNMEKKGIMLRHEMKYRFKMMQEDMSRARNSFLRFTEAVCDLPENEYDTFTDDSEMYRDAFMLFLDRVFENNELGGKVVALLLSLPSSGMFNDSIMERNKYYRDIYNDIKEGKIKVELSIK